ncbi:MAG: FxsA family protein [Halobacteriales archaeon]|nr:FxsA family protein [Halobacteriales archaeon]
MVKTRWVLLGLLVIPLVDIALLIYVAGLIGAVATVLLVVLTGLIGLLLVRAEGRHTLNNIQRKVAQGEAPTDELLDGGFLIAAGAFLLTPGLVTDGIGLLLVLPPSRYVIRKAVKRWVVVPALDRKSGGFVTGNVYVGGFPNMDGGSSGGSQATGAEGRSEQDDLYDLDEDAYDVDIDDGDDDQKKP